MTRMQVQVSILGRIFLTVLRVVCKATVFKLLQDRKGVIYVKQSLSQKELLAKATTKYAANIYQAEDYLAGRGITREVARMARFGVVTEPETGHEAFIGRLSIPYITKTGIVDLRFERVFVYADGDQPGKEFASSLARELPVTIVSMPDGEDVNSVYVKYGADYILEKAGLNE